MAMLKEKFVGAEELKNRNKKLVFHELNYFPRLVCFHVLCWPQSTSRLARDVLCCCLPNPGQGRARLEQVTTAKAWSKIRLG